MIPTRTRTTLNLRVDFPLLKNHPTLAYLDSAATTHQPEVVMKAQQNFIETSYANVHRAVYKLANTATEAYEAARTTVATFINAQPNEIIFTSNATQALNLAAALEKSRLRPGDEILVSIAEHHSNLLPWQRVAKQTGAILTWIELTPDGQVDFTDFTNKLSAKTKIVAVSHLSNVLGSVAPLNEIISAAHRVRAHVVVDAAQSASRLPLDVYTLDLDYLAVSGHKLYGPTGIGFLYGKQTHLEKAEPLLVGGGTVQEVTRHTATWQDSPLRFEAGTPNITGAIGLNAAINYLTQIGLGAIWEHEQTLVRYALPRLAEIDGLRLYSTGEAGLFSFNLSANQQTLHSHDVSEIANQHDVALRGGHHCAQPLMAALGVADLTRASIGVYTTTQDIDRLIEALEATKKVFSN